MPTSPSKLQAKWIKLSNKNQGVVTPPRSGHASFFIPGPSSDQTTGPYIFGGYAEDTSKKNAMGMPERNVVNDQWHWDASSGWTKLRQGDKNSMPPARLATACTVLPETNTAILFGGWDPQTPGTGGIMLDSVHAYNPQTQEWEEVKGVTIPGGGCSRHVAVSLSMQTKRAETDEVVERAVMHNHRCDNHVLLYKQTSTKETNPDNTQNPSYKLQSAQFIKQPTKGESPSSRGLHTAACVTLTTNTNNKNDNEKETEEYMIVFGGASQDGAMCNDVHVLKCSTWEWMPVTVTSSKKNLPAPRAGACMCPLDSMLDANSNSAPEAQEEATVLLFGGAETHGGGLRGRGDTWALHLSHTPKQNDGLTARWESLQEDVYGGSEGGGVHPPPRNAASLTPIHGAALGVGNEEEEEGSGGKEERVQYFVLHGGWEPFRETFHDNFVLQVKHRKD